MAQLKDYCVAVSGPLILLEEIERLIAERIVPAIETERVAFSATRGRVVASDVEASVNLPQFANPAVDGYSMRRANLRKHQDTALKVSGDVTAGRSAPALSAAGRAVRIFTDAPMPAGADAVFMQEDVHIGAVVRPAGRVFDAQHSVLGGAQIPSRIFGFAPPITLLRLAIDVTQSGR